MKYEQGFYQEQDNADITRMILASYSWEYPIWGLSRHEFCKGLHPAFTGILNAWKKTVGIFRLKGTLVAAVINEGTYGDEVFFLFDSKERGLDIELLTLMIKFAQTYAARILENRKTRAITIVSSRWNTVLATLLMQAGFVEEKKSDSQLILPFIALTPEISPLNDSSKKSQLPDGYSFSDGSKTPALYLANVHRHAFAYGGDNHACDNGVRAFTELRTMEHYQSELELCVFDKDEMPVAMAIVWNDAAMPYCELEPMAVVWWERRKGLGSALIYELARRVQIKNPNCQGMLGGDQNFYSRLGFEKKSETIRFHWETDVIISWEAESYNKDYRNIVFGT